jgi:alpha-tubulin suppressor-like RCC1 family protein
MAIKTDNTMWGWGSGSQYRLGLGDNYNRSSPTQVGALTVWSQVAAANRHSLAITISGSLWSWGINSSGQLGLGDDLSRSTPAQVGALTTWSFVAAGDYFSVAIKTDGTMWSWGNNGSGRLGLNDTANRSSPVQIGALTNWTKVSAIANYGCVAIKTDGSLWSWGAGSSGRLGLGDVENRSSPVQVGALTTWSQVSSVKGTCLAIKTDGTLWAWGYNFFGNLGQNDSGQVSGFPLTNRSSPVQVGALTTWTKLPVSSFGNNSLAIKG